MCVCVYIYMSIYIKSTWRRRDKNSKSTLNVYYKFTSCNLENTQTYVQFQECFGSTKKMNRFHIDL